MEKIKRKKICKDMVAVVRLLSRVQLFVTPWTAAGQASLSFTLCSVDYEGYSISSKGWLPTVVVLDIMVIWIKFACSSPF